MIISKHGGKIPVSIKAVPEGTAVETHNVLMTIINTDPEIPFITNFIESLLLKVWYSTTVATLSWEIRRLITKYCKETGCEFNSFSLNDFGYRGVSSEESAEIGGAAHLISSSGTDNLLGIQAAMKYYAAEVCGFSVMAAEHSTITAYGPENEEFAYETLIDKCPPDGILSIVSDSYDLYNAVDTIFGKKLRAKILKRDGKLVVRPDSGHPPTVTVQVLESLWKNFGGTVNEKGFKVLNPKVGVIYGDGINYNSIGDILKAMKEAGFATSNVVFGMGGALLQQCHRDTFKFAIKCSATCRNGVWAPVFKRPKTDAGKNSKRGILALRKKDGRFVTEENLSLDNIGEDAMVEVFRNGVLLNETTFDEIRKRAEESL